MSSPKTTLSLGLGDVKLSTPELDKATRQMQSPRTATKSTVARAMRESTAFQTLVSQHVGEALSEISENGFRLRIDILTEKCIAIGFEIGRRRSIQ